ncbi:hypothetical protein SAMN05216481_12536 [Streptomyces radiopugnans]|uniref:Uncharacterized protein n=2 Tax=Streptomyces radiopugnans TaxID=403935 RepID=A0A1H9KM79_9ACTN|nr:hypothetical protein SAMN05216481_12536 [Streptomyces radiopugnans]
MGRVMIPSPDEVEAARTPAGGWTRDQLAAWGVPWPPPAGWKQRLADQWHAARQSPHRDAAPSASGGGGEPPAVPGAGVVRVPGPEPDWQPAPALGYHVGKNPVTQYSLWEAASTFYRLVAGLTPPLEAVAARLRLEVERTWEELGEVDVALFRIQGTDFALSRFAHREEPRLFVWLNRSQRDVEAALEVLLDALGVGREAVAFTEDDLKAEQSGRSG